ncbi:TIGR02757 family protein [Flectobacillus major]|uniref:TIGR02757 family protein n=1 Tax=Flectobacillus major TaxID=103 RepID=UPI00041082AB|nr:TIGR02757 family protein [Flectobacillus major]
MNSYVAQLLDEKFHEFNRPNFIPNDPICIPHRFSLKQDIEIMGFWASILAWGQRKTIINKCNELVLLMDGAPYQFITQHQSSDLKRFLAFKHRTFNATDTLYFIEWFKNFYLSNDSLESAFSRFLQPNDTNIEKALLGFHQLFFSLDDYPQRTQKHIATPARKSSCKRINMFLRWMVRQDTMGVDFGIWQQIKPSQLVCPCDVHVDRVARKLGLIQRPKTDWLTALELTENLKSLDPTDPVKYDFALFGLGVEKEM